MKSLEVAIYPSINIVTQTRSGNTETGAACSIVGTLKNTSNIQVKISSDNLKG
jgi:hypothetical protein